MESQRSWRAVLGLVQVLELVWEGAGFKMLVWGVLVAGFRVLGGCGLAA